MKTNPSYPESMTLFNRAERVIPGGIYGHMSPAAALPLELPYFAQRAKGCRYWDVDGNEFIDYMCAYGPIVLGYNHPEVEEAAQRQAKDGNCFNHPAPVMVELAEKLVSLVDFADWTVFGKNGSDMTTWATLVAREYTQRKKILRIQGSYHGAHAWCTPGHGGLIEEDRMNVHTFEWNDLEDFQWVMKKFRNQVACVIVTPFHHPAFGDSELPGVDFLQEIEKSCRKEGIVLILDDIRAGFRLHLGGSHRFFNFEPDIICFSKAMGNGYPISAALGRKELNVAASNVFLTGSFWNSAVPMAASLACIKILERENLIDHMRDMGDMLTQELHRLAEKHGLLISVSGPSTVPFMSFANEKNFFRSQCFSAECARRGVFFHPHHNWFICAAHEEKDIRQTLGIADQAFSVVKEKFGS